MGSHHIAVRGAVNRPGGDLTQTSVAATCGHLPLLRIGGPDDTQFGRWIPTTGGGSNHGSRSRRASSVRSVTARVAASMAADKAVNFSTMVMACSSRFVLIFSLCVKPGTAATGDADEPPEPRCHASLR